MKEDEEMIKKFLKKFRKEVGKKTNEIKKFYNNFDGDGDEQFELEEWNQMMDSYFKKEKFAKDKDMRAILFDMFDENDQGYFNYKRFEDIVLKREDPDTSEVARVGRKNLRLKASRTMIKKS